MELAFIVLFVSYLGFVSPYTWTYNDWMNQVWKRWGNKNTNNKKVNEPIKCKTKNIKGSTGQIETPNYPLHYPNNADCSWIIETPNEYTEIQLDLIKFSVENPKWSKICFKDRVTIYQYIDGKREKKGTYCGKKSGQNIAVYGNKVEIVFKSNGYRTKKGFQIKWTAKKGCGGLLSGNHGNLILPKSQQTHRHFYCEWKIKAPSTHNQIEVTINSLVFARNYSSCRRGRLSVLDGNNQELGRFCDSNVPHKMRISGDEAVIQIQISKKTRHHQFQATWRSSYQNYEALQCGISSTEHHRRRRLVGGKLASQGASPWVVQIRTMMIGKNYRTKIVTCGGVIISPTLILTAAHCVVQTLEIIKFEVLLGSISEYSTKQNTMTLSANDVISHPNYKWNGRKKIRHIPTKIYI